MESGRSFDRILGVDLGGGKGKKTAVATLRPDADGVAVVGLAPRPRAAPLYDQALLELIKGDQGDRGDKGDNGDNGDPARTLLCIDAPLTLPPCLRCTVPVCPGQTACVDPAVVEMLRLAEDIAVGRDGRRGKPAVTPYTQRPVELRLVRERSVAPRETLGQGTGPLAARAAHLLRALANRFRLNENLLEVYPKGTLQALGHKVSYKRHLHERERRAQILEALAPDLRFGPGVWRETCVQSDHLFEAVISAYTGYLWARDGWTLPEAWGALYAKDGWIWLPPPAQEAAVGQPPPAGPKLAPVRL